MLAAFNRHKEMPMRPIAARRPGAASHR